MLISLNTLGPSSFVLLVDSVYLETLVVLL